MFSATDKIGNQVQFLIDDADALPQCFARIGKTHRLTIEQNFALGGLLRSGENMHQRGLAGTVFTDQTVNFTGVEIKVHVIQRQHAGEFLDDATA